MIKDLLDEKWFQSLRDIYDGVPARLVASSYNEARKKFFDGDDAAPNFSYSIISDQRFKEKKSALTLLREQIHNCNTTHPVVKKIYLQKIDEKLSSLDIVRVASELVSSDTCDGLLASKFISLTNKVFGPVQPDVFAQACAVVLRQLSDLSISTEQYRVFSNVANVLERGTASSQHSIADLEIQSKVPEGALVTDQSVVIRQFKSALEEHGFGHWKVEPGGKLQTTFVVKSKHNRIVVPNQTALRNRVGNAKITERKLQAIIAHEMTHVLRYEHGINSPLRLLAIGLPGYHSGEEGYATYCEQQIQGATDYAGGKYYIAAGLAAGLDRGGESRNFREMYNFMHDWYCLEESGGERDPKKLAFHFCSVLFKGVRGHNPGVFLTLQTSYREGNIAVHKAMAEYPDWEEFGRIGKYDFTNKTHVVALQELGILPSL